ncbi:unnamed protein product [Ixodes pacificus]
MLLMLLRIGCLARRSVAPGRPRRPVAVATILRRMAATRFTRCACRHRTTTTRCWSASKAQSSTRLGSTW